MKNRMISALIPIAMLVFILFFVIIPFSSSDDINSQPHSSDKQVHQRLVVKLTDNKLCLYDSDIILKTYDINASVLPSEDILLLSEGIEVSNIAEADSFAENFDG